MPRVKKEVNSKQCTKCLDYKNPNSFHVSYSSMHGDGKVPVCKDCLLSMFNDRYDGSNAHEVIQDIMKQIDKPYIYHLAETSIESSKNGNERTDNVFLIYMKNVAMRQYTGMTYKESDFGDNEENEDRPQIKNESNFDIEELKEKYGYGYPDEEYLLFEKKYQQLRSSFQLVTTMHEEYFREYCINKVKETLAKAKGNFKEAKEWSLMVKDVADAGKLKPSQMSKADLSGGLDTFGQLARMVEENHEIMPILPNFIEQPKDKVDVVLWCFINYVRDLKGLPSCEYKEIYEFYNIRKMEYESHMTDNEYSDEVVDSDG